MRFTGTRIHGGWGMASTQHTKVRALVNHCSSTITDHGARAVRQLVLLLSCHSSAPLASTTKSLYPLEMQWQCLSVSTI